MHGKNQARRVNVCFSGLFLLFFFPRMKGMALACLRATNWAESSKLSLCISASLCFCKEVTERKIFPAAHQNNFEHRAVRPICSWYGEMSIVPVSTDMMASASPNCRGLRPCG